MRRDENIQGARTGKDEDSVRSCVSCGIRRRRSGTGSCLAAMYVFLQVLCFTLVDSPYAGGGIVSDDQSTTHVFLS